MKFIIILLMFCTAILAQDTIFSVQNNLDSLLVNCGLEIKEITYYPWQKSGFIIGALLEITSLMLTYEYLESNKDYFSEPKDEYLTIASALDLMAGISIFIGVTHQRKIKVLALSSEKSALPIPSENIKVKGKKGISGKTATAIIVASFAIMQLTFIISSMQ